MPELAAGGEKSPGPQRDSELRLKVESGSGSGWNPFFKRFMGTLDSLQCMSGAHQTVHSSCPVNHQTAQCRRGFARAQSVHQTLHNAVFGAHRTVR
jgi:hypothetical protein